MKSESVWPEKWTECRRDDKAPTHDTHTQVSETIDAPVRYPYPANPSNSVVGNWYLSPQRTSGGERKEANIALTEKLTPDEECTLLTPHHPTTKKKNYGTNFSSLFFKKQNKNKEWKCEISCFSCAKMYNCECARACPHAKCLHDVTRSANIYSPVELSTRRKRYSHCTDITRYHLKLKL